MIMDSFKKHMAVWGEGAGRFFANHGLTSAGNMAFLAMLSLFPFLIFLVSLSGLLGQSERGLEAVEFFFSVVPPEVASTIRGPIEGVIKNTRPEILTGSILFAIWTAANGVESAREVLIKAFGPEFARPVWLRRLESLGIVIIAASLLLLSMSILVLGPALMKGVISLFPDQINSSLIELWGYLRFVISPLVLLVGVYGLYMALTPRRVKKAHRLPGSILTVLILYGTAAGLSVYLKFAGGYDVTYGSLAGIVITQLFCFIVSIGFILGAEINAAYTRHDHSNDLEIDRPSAAEYEDDIEN